MLVRWPMARGAPASRLSHVSPDVYAGEPCGRMFLHVYAYTYRIKANSRACARTWFTYTHTMYASACTRMFCAHSFMGRLHCNVTVVSTCSFSLDISVLSCVKKEKKKRRKRDLLLFTFIFVDKNDVAAKRKKERAVIKSVTKTECKYFNVSARN